MSRIDFPAVVRLAALTFVLACAGQSATLAQFDFSTDISSFGSEGSTEVEVSLQFVPASGSSPAQLSVTAVIPEGFHLYSMDQGALPDNGGGPMATTLQISPDSPVKLLGEWQPSKAPHTRVDNEIWVGLEIREYDGQITWTAPVELVAGAQSQVTVDLEGQICNPNTCIPIEETAQLQVDTGGPASDANPSAKSLPQQEFSGSPDSYDLSRIELQDSEEKSILYYLITAFIGGIVLNIMPCVLPVIGLKVMSFVQQAGQSRAQALILNCWYSLGIIAVFLILGSLAVTLKLRMGDQFSNAGFNLSLIGIVFAMALSLLGVWEIPIPGFVGSHKAMSAADREGPLAALLKGVLTTLLATPCLGPFMATALAWAVKQPVWVTYSVFGSVGLGMASPYLLIGAFPNLVNFLPKPGAWMETFKQVTGFILMLTVVWLMSFIDSALVVPTVLMLVGISIGCWWVSRTSVTASTTDKFFSWATAGLLILISVMGSFGLLGPVMEERFQEEVAAYALEEVDKKTGELANKLADVESTEQLQELTAEFANSSAEDTGEPWQPFNLEKLGRIAVQEGRTVMVDFTADWCTNCKALEKFVLKTKPVEEEIARASIVTMEADYTKKPPEIRATLDALGAAGVPVIAIFPASDPYKPIVFADGVYTQEDLVEAIAVATNQGLRTPDAPSIGQTSLTRSTAAEPRY